MIAVDHHVVLFCFAPEHRMVLEHEDAGGRTGAQELVRGEHPGESTAHDDAIVHPVDRGR